MYPHCHGGDVEDGDELAEETGDIEIRLLRENRHSGHLERRPEALDQALLCSRAYCRVAARWLVLAAVCSLLAVCCIRPDVSGRRAGVAELSETLGLDAIEADGATSCRAIGCFGKYDPDHACQCNDQCGHYLNCCEDFIRACELELPAGGAAGKAAPPAASEQKRAREPNPLPPPNTTSDQLSSTTTMSEKRHAKRRRTTTRRPTTSTSDPKEREGKAQTTSTREFPRQSESSSDVPRCETREMCLRIVDLFLNGQPRSFGLLQALGNQKIGGSACGESCKLSTACPQGDCGYITYDNAVAAIYYTKRGELRRAKEILDAFRRALYPEDLTLLRPRNPDALYEGPVSRQALTLLASSYSAGYRPVPGNYERPFVTDGTVDAGSNAWVALAFAHYAAAAGAPCYANVAREILDAVAHSGSCPDMLQGFLGALPPRTGSSRSTERNVVIYAAANLLGVRNAKEKAANFVQKMHCTGESARTAQSYAAGTGSDVQCDESTPHNAPLLAAASFWTVLSDVDPDEERMTDLLRYALKRRGARRSERQGFWSHDRDTVWMSGAGATPELYGFQYTDAGQGVHWETTASAVMALMHFKQLYGDKELNLHRYIDKARLSLSKLLGMYKGVPASVLGKDDLQSDAKLPGESALGFAGMRYLTVAATAWTGLLYLYDEAANGTLKEDANPYATPRLSVPHNKETCWHTSSPDDRPSAGGVV